MYLSLCIEQAYFNNYLLEEQECLYNLYKVKEKCLHYTRGKYKFILYRYACGLLYVKKLTCFTRACKI